MASLPPGLHVFYANQVERLVAQLALDLALFRGAEGVWKPATIVVPNPNVKDFLRASFAEAFGAVANLHFSYLEGFWGRHANRPLLDRSTLTGSILSVLQDADTARDAGLQPLTSYLEGEPVDLKTVQLGQRLSHHLERLLLQRPDWIRGWDRGLPARGAEPVALEAWQRALWRRLRRAWKGSKEPPLPLIDWLEDASFAQAPFPEAVFLFGMSHMAPVFHHALAQVGTRASVRLYLVNPCEEPWDLDARAKPTYSGDDLPEGLEGEDPFALHSDRAEVILQRWARPAREQLRLLAGLAQGDFLGRFEAPDGAGLLPHLQRRILASSSDREPWESSDPNDDSLGIIPCPSPRREAETVANLIWDLVQRSGGDLHFGDIGVLVPASEQEAYQEHLAAAFRSAHQIPWARAFGASRALHDLVEACELLLDLAGGDLSRASLLRAASHPFIQARLGTTPETWAQLCEQAGIVARLDAAETEGTYVEGGRWTWDEGLTRLALGRFMKDDAAVEELGAMGHPLGRAESPALVALLGPLTADLRALGQGRFPLAIWQERLETFLSTYLGPEAESTSEGEAEAFEKVRKALQKVTQLQVPGLPWVTLDFQALRSLVKGALEALMTDSALPPGRGVQVSCYTPLRAIPFKVLFLMGLGEGLFPNMERPDPLDLVASSPRRAGDVSRPEQDRQLFLEALLCTRQHLVCTYPSRAAITGEPLQPSPLLQDLAETLGEERWSAACLPEQPLHRHDLSQFPDLQAPTPGAPQPLPCHNPAARREAEARWLGQRLRQEIGQRDLPRHLPSAGGSPALQAVLETRVAGCGPIAEVEAPLPSRLRLTLKDLRRWLECPVQGGVVLRLGVRSQDEDDPSDVEEVPVDSGPLDQWWLLRRSFWHAAATHTHLATAYAQTRHDLEGQAKVPIGPLGEGEGQRHLNTLKTWCELVGEVREARLHRFGAGLPFETQGLPLEDHGALLFDLPHPQGLSAIQLEGLTEPLCGDAFLLLSTTECGKEGPKERDRLASLRAWLSHVALCAAGASVPRSARLHSAPREANPAVWQLPLPAIPQPEAQSLLEGWCREILADDAPRLLPIEALLASRPVTDLADWIQDQSDQEDRATLTSFRGPVPRVKDLEVEDLEVGRRRLAPFLALQSQWERP
ncbi:exodeoxyribonuclease V subunit gamma [Geothrix sp. PMB-07]|uniref:exodeoxyribonuclease V subunit gamma n=1 Tax=Geothrix sp. PMB-07 TaxID=3068640 RepID=UPI002740404D|nr:exodeoxyribonuclease V subunit gamma [Geothrix sp. PMB-07]WLT30987.1 exodeoxyribonuclease V subunit gamma [Geothrix sp. PMB-07]